MAIHHLITGARSPLSLVRDDADRLEMLEAARRALGRALLAYCIMDTHLHLVAETPAERGARRLAEALSVYARRFRRRADEPFLRGPVQAIACPGEVELARLLRYVHANPLKCDPPLARRAVDYRWSSARAYAGLSRAGVVNVERALALLGRSAGRVVEAVRAADLAPARFPQVALADVLAAAADLHGLPPGALAGPRRGGLVAQARAAYMRLGALEGFTVLQLAGPLGRSRAQAYRLAAEACVPEADVRAARTLLRMRAPPRAA